MTARVNARGCSCDRCHARVIESFQRMSGGRHPVRSSWVNVGCLACGHSWKAPASRYVGHMALQPAQPGDQARIAGAYWRTHRGAHYYAGTG